MAEQVLDAVAFPRLDEAQLAALERCACPSRKRYRDGQTLIEAGDPTFKFFVISSGQIEILDPGEEPPKTLAILGPGEFTGEATHLTGGRSLVTAVARGEVDVYEISPDALRVVLERCPEVSDVILQAFMARRQILREPGRYAGVRVVGSRYSRDTFRIRDFLSKNRVPFRWFDIESDPDVLRLLGRFGIRSNETPVVALGKNLLLRNPSDEELGEALGIRRPLQQHVFDLVIVGAGPSGLAAAVYGASEGLDTLVLERMAPGGQAGTSMRIENYLGFPTGLTGGELMERAVLQAEKFGAALTVPVAVTELTFDGEYPRLRLDNGDEVATKCLLIATGAQYRKLPVEGCDEFEGAGVFYAATPNELQFCRGQEVAVVGAGNSAGQASVYLAENTRKVYLLVRGDSLYNSMSAYLAKRIEETENIEVLLNTNVTRMRGDKFLSEVEIKNDKTGELRRLRVAALFSFIGAAPRTEWLKNEIATDDHGFVRTGPEVAEARAASTASSGPPANARRAPFLLETNRRGVFAAGDVRSGSIKRVASAVGEGAMSVQLVHEHFKQS
jgi:thioredoxin reductase (NADPH)